MNETPEAANQSSLSALSTVRKSSLSIALFAVLAAAVIAFTQVGTKDRIIDNIRAAQSRALFEIFSAEIDPQLFDHQIALDAMALNLNPTEPAVGYQAIVDDQVVGVILPVRTTEGYSGDIELLVGINPDTSIQGVRVVTHRETPGLGDNIELSKSDWILSFNGKVRSTSDDPKWAVKKDGGEFDQFTGATITPRAIVDATGVALDYFNANPTLLIRPQTSQASEETDR